ncbi:hypothetical protein, partial [Enterococcus faecalis]|uniref:hypothetical protein n=1 Tax=Enterococcus faecalis TaxID=1351 RepID=UPI001C2535B3
TNVVLRIWAHLPELMPAPLDNKQHQLLILLSHTKLVAAKKTDAQSVLNYYKKLIALRKDNPVFTDGQFELLAPNHPSVFAF